MRTAALLSVIVLLGTSLIAAQPQRVVVTPQEINDLLANPGMGWQTFHRFADEDKALAGLPSSSAYFRFYWNEIEPEEGKIDFPKLDGLLARARNAGQKLAFRIMCAGTNSQYMYVPAWLKDKGCKGFEYQYAGQGPKHWVPDFEDPMFQQAHFRMIEELGKRYDSHADVDLLDIGSVGLWGEWHMSQTGVKMPTLETRRKIVEAWCKAFPNTPKVMLIGDEEGLRSAFKLGGGWRADCLGDMGGFSKNWNHMKNMYPQQIEKTAAEDVWKKAPVAYESCWDMRKWKQEGWDIRAIYDYALATHASYMNNKSAGIPEGTREEVERFLRKLGYRLVLRTIEHEPQAELGGELAVKMTWENVGVAPPYRDYLLGVRLTDATGKTHVIATKTSIKGWLPGKTELNESIRIPKDLALGRHKLAVGVLDPTTRKPAVKLAIAGRDEEGWYSLTNVELKQ